MTLYRPIFQTDAGWQPHAGAAAGGAWQASAAGSGSGAKADRLTLWMLLLPILGASVFSKFAVPGVRADGIGMGFPLIYLALAIGACLAGNLRFEPARLMFFGLMAGVIGGLSVLQGGNFSLPSLAFLMLLHLPYVLHVAGSEHVLDRLGRAFLNVAAMIAFLGLGQYALQFFVPAAYVFPLENFLPPEWRVTGFNMQAPIAYGSGVYRANGVFMQEPSFFSQFLAIAALVELAGPGRLWRLALYFVAIITSHSGTGLILLAIGMPLLVIARRPWSVVSAVLIAGLLLFLAAPYLHIEHLIARVGEFASERSSAYERFVGGFRIFESSIAADPARMLLGYGAGNYRDLAHDLNHPAAEMTLFKMVIEYGVIGSLLYFGFMLFCIFGTRAPFALRLALAISLFLNGAYNTFVHSMALALLVWPSTSLARQDEHASGRQKQAIPAASAARLSW